VSIKPGWGGRKGFWGFIDIGGKRVVKRIHAGRKTPQQDKTRDSRMITASAGGGIPSKETNRNKEKPIKRVRERDKAFLLGHASFYLGDAVERGRQGVE